MKIRIIALFTVLLGMALGTQAAPTVGDTIWLHNDEYGDYVGNYEGSLVAKNIGEGNALNFVVEDADGSGSNVLLRVDGTSDYVKLDLDDSTILKTNGSGADTNNTLTHFSFTDITGGIAFYCVGDTNDSPWVGVQGAKKYLKVRNSASGASDSLFTYGTVGGGLEPPTGLGANASDSQVVLDWDDDTSGEASYYSVYRSTNSPVTLADTKLGDPTDSTFTDTNVVNGTTYYYAVSVTDAEWTETDLSDEVSATPPTGTEQPQSPSATGVAGAVMLNWRNDGTGHLDYYTIYRSTSSNLTTSSPVLTNVTSSAFNDLDIVGGTTYYYAVTAFGTNGVPQESALSDEVSATPFAAVTDTVLFQHIDATATASVQTNGAGEVTNVVDQSTFGNDAVDVIDDGGEDGDLGPVLWPGTFDNGLNGFNMGTNMCMLDLFSGGTEAFLDFTGAAAGSDGFAMLIAFKTRTVTEKANIFLQNGPLSLEYQNDGVMTLELGETTISQPGAVVEAGDTIVYALNYNAWTGELTFWDSKNNAESAATVEVYGDFSSSPMYLGGSGNDNRVFDGLIGEVKIFSTKLPVDDFQAERDAMAVKWGASKPGGLSAISGDEIVILDWADYNVGTVSNYMVYRSASSPVTSNDVLATVVDSGYIDTAVVNGTTNYYAISATDTNGSVSPLSAEVSATPIAANPGGLFQHIDADNESSVSLTNGNEVVSVADQTANGNDAVANAGTVLYPSSSLSESGKDGLDFSLNTNRNNLVLGDAATAESLLDFSKAGAKNSGVAMLVAFKVDAFEDNSNPLIATDVSGGLSLEYNGNGDIQVELGSVQLVQPGASLSEGDTVVYSFNYTAKTGVMKFWDSKNDDVQTAINSLYGSFNNDAALLLGGNHNDNREMVGMIGEVKVYNKSLSDAELAIEQDALVAKWGTTVATGFEVWVNSWGVNLGSDTNDWDTDGINNLAEYAFAGNPTNGLDDTYTDLTADGGLVYIHPQPKGDAGLNYEVQTVDNLTGDTWADEGYTSVIGTYEPVDGDYNYVSNSVPTTDPVKFIRANAGY